MDCARLSTKITQFQHALKDMRWLEKHGSNYQLTFYILSDKTQDTIESFLWRFASKHITNVACTDKLGADVLRTQQT
jgi:hypothetical protein